MATPGYPGDVHTSVSMSVESVEFTKVAGIQRAIYINVNIMLALRHVRLHYGRTGEHMLSHYSRVKHFNIYRSITL